MGVIKRFAVGSMALGVLAIVGGASALAFDGGSGQGAGIAPAEQPAPFSEASSEVVSDVPSDETSELLPDTGASTSDSGAWRWVAPRGR